MRFEQKIYLFLASLTIIFIFYNSSQPRPYGLIVLSNVIPIIYHFSIFFLLSLFLLLSIGKINDKIVLVALLVSFVYAAFDEMHQYFVPGRSSSLFDFGIDSLGIIFAFLFIILVKYLKENDIKR